MNNFKKARKAANLTQEEVAQKLGLTRAAYTHYEKGTRECPFDTLRKLASIFNVSVDYLLGREVLNMPSIPQDEINLLKGFRNLTQDGREALLYMLNALQRNNSVTA